MFNALEVADETGVTVDQLRRLWRALGFPEHGLEVAFTKADAEAVSLLNEIVESGVIDFDTAVNLTRAVGQTMARLSDWEVGTLAHRVEELEAGEQATGSRSESALRMLHEINPAFENLLIYVWRRHLAAAVARVEELGANEEDLHIAHVTVGFVDIVGFTALSNEIGQARIGDIVELFESRCADVVAGKRGRVIKSIGDSVLFVNDDPIRAYDTAEGIINVVGRDPRMPDVRVGLASGSVVMRLGDVFGPPVNMAVPDDRRGPPQPDHRRRGDGRAAAGGPVRDPAAPRPSGPGIRAGRAGRRTPALGPDLARTRSHNSNVCARIGHFTFG